MTAQIHPLAFVDDTVSIGKGTRIWQFASVIRGTRLGENCNVASGATLDGPRFGNRCIICHNVAMGPGFWFGDDVFVGPNVTICNDAWPATHTRGFDQAALRAGYAPFVTVRVGDGVAIGANAVVLPGVVIGNHAVVAAGAVVDRAIPADHLLRRSGEIVSIRPEWRERRMRRSECDNLNSAVVVEC